MTTDEPLTIQFRSREMLTADIERDPNGFDAWAELINLEAWEDNIDTAISIILRAADAVPERDRFWRLVDEFA